MRSSPVVRLAEVGKFRSNTLRPLHNPFSRPVCDPVYTNKKCVIETGTLFWDRWKHRCKGLDYVLTVTMRNTLLLYRSWKPSLSECPFFFFFLYVCLIILPSPPSSLFAWEIWREMIYTLNLSFLKLDHVIYKQLQINIKYTFRLVFLLHALILKANKQLFPRC